MLENISRCEREGATRREFLKEVGQTALAGGLAVAASGEPQRSAAAEAAAQSQPGKVRHRILGKTGLRVSEIGFGGHSWSYSKLPDGSGHLRRVSRDEAKRMIAQGLELGVNFFDSCTPPEEHTVPGEVIKELKKRDQIVVSARLCHKMKGVRKDQEIITTWVEQRLKLWQTDRFDILMLTNEVNDTPATGYWDMSYSLETIERLKRQGKIRFAGFGCHFTPQWFRDAFTKFGRAWDVCSMPYNVRHRMAEELIPQAKRLGLGIVGIKAFARGALLEGRGSGGTEAGLARDMLVFVLENREIDCCICGMHSEAHVRENFSASWTRLTPEARARLLAIAAAPCGNPVWLEQGWRGTA